MEKKKLSLFIKKRAKELGFLSCGISKSCFLEDEAKNLENWLKNKYNGKMHYMENHFDKRLNPSLLVDGAKSVISFAYNYFPEKIQNADSFKVAKYAYGKDYHFVINDILNVIIEELKEKIGDFNFRIFIDSAPVLERAWAKKSGLGWIGKNSLLLSKNKGSFFFLAEIICDLDLEYDLSFKTNHCGTCSKCVDLCPTEAIIFPSVIDSKKCISYLTIELKNEIDNEFKGKFNDWIFGCDICQDVCPWNRFSVINNEKEFSLIDEILNFSKSDWFDLEEESFRKIFKYSPIKRAKFSGIKRNIKINQ